MINFKFVNNIFPGWRDLSYLNCLMFVGHPVECGDWRVRHVLGSDRKQNLNIVRIRSILRVSGPGSNKASGQLSHILNTSILTWIHSLHKNPRDGSKSWKQIFKSVIDKFGVFTSQTESSTVLNYWFNNSKV